MTKVRTTIPVRFDRLPDRSHDIVFDGIAQLPKHLADAGLAVGRAVIVTDANVGHLYGETVDEAMTASGWSCTTVTLPPGEKTK